MEVKWGYFDRLILGSLFPSERFEIAFWPTKVGPLRTPKLPQVSTCLEILNSIKSGQKSLKRSVLKPIFAQETCGSSHGTQVSAAKELDARAIFSSGSLSQKGLLHKLLVPKYRIFKQQMKSENRCAIDHHFEGFPTPEGLGRFLIKC